MPDSYDCLVTIEKENGVGNRAGQISQSPLISVYTALPLRKHFYSAQSLKRFPEGPGIETKKMQLFITEQKPFPILIQENMFLTVTTIYDDSGSPVVLSTPETYKITGIRFYQYTMQIDAFVILKN